MAVETETDFGLSSTLIFQWRRVEYPSQTKPSRTHVWQSSSGVSGMRRSQGGAVIVPGSPLSQNALRVTQVQQEPSFSRDGGDSVGTTEAEGLGCETTRLLEPFMFFVAAPLASNQSPPLADESTVCSFPCSAEGLPVVPFAAGARRWGVVPVVQPPALIGQMCDVCPFRIHNHHGELKIQDGHVVEMTFRNK